MSHEPKPSEHAIAAGEQIAHDSERFAQIRAYLTPEGSLDSCRPTSSITERR